MQRFAGPLRPAAQRGRVRRHPNSYAAAEEPGVLRQSALRIERQLRDGIRAFLIDVHYGVRDDDSDRVRTDLATRARRGTRSPRELSPRRFARPTGSPQVGLGR